jgi:D-aminopeptidase
LVTVKTKEASGRIAAKMLHPSRGRTDVELALLTSAMADMAELMPGTRRAGARTAAHGARDSLDVYKAMLAMVRLAPSAVPPEQS